MTIGERIKARREQIGMTQEDLAFALGYKSKSSINKIEVGRQELTQKKILLTAQVLGTTVSYIMGWDDAQEELVSAGGDIEDVAAELGISTQALLSMADGNDPKAIELVAKVARMIAESLKKQRTKMTREKLQFALWGGEDGMDDDDLQAVLDYAEYVRERKKKRSE